MKGKLLSIMIITLFAFSTLPMTLASQNQAINPIKMMQQIDENNLSLLSDLDQINFAQLTPDTLDSSIIAHARPVPQPKSYALTIEIDYIEGHAPTQSVLDYMKAYYTARNIELTINVDDSITSITAYSNGISNAEFWNIEAANNEGTDVASSSSDGQYILPEKWVLFGTSVEDSTNTVGYTYVVANSRDLVAGNYIFIADGAADAWATQKGVSQTGAETVLLMHEFGHSIGICTVRAGSEVYCSDYYCVMSYLRVQNAGNTNQWYYCNNHWKTVNLDYYTVA